jgi:hypothetical protein
VDAFRDHLVTVERAGVRRTRRSTCAAGRTRYPVGEAAYAVTLAGNPSSHQRTALPPPLVTPCRSTTTT